jgi:hypothetical protein
MPGHCVVPATSPISRQSAEGPYYEIEVRFRLDRDDTAPFTTDFNESFLDAMRIVDAAGNTFGCSPSPVDAVYRAGGYRSDRYSCLFRYSQSSEGVSDFAKVGTRPADFQLIINNPEPRDGQPRRVIVQLE